MQPVILFTSDWQCQLQNLDRCEQALEQLINLCNEWGVTHVVNLGDVKEVFNPVDQRVTNFLVHMTTRLCEKVEFLVLRGNHDHIGVNDASPTCLPVMAAAGAGTFEKPTLVALERVTKLGRDWNVKLHFVPFFRDPIKFQEALLPPKERKNVVLCFHQDLLGARSLGYTSKDGVNVEALEGYQFAIGGHIHTPQTNGNVTYVGSPFCQDWSEVNQLKRFLILKEGELHSVPSTVPGWHDPNLPGYKPKTWVGCRVRLTQDHTDPEVLSKRYQGAELVLVPEKPATALTKGGITFDPQATDRQLITNFLGGKAMPKEAKALVPYLASKLQGTSSPSSRVTFKRVWGKNVLCFEEVDFQLDYPGVTLVTGVNKDWENCSNGSGKSSLLSLPLLALFGYTPKDESHDDWVREGSGGKSMVALEMDTTEGPQVITRKRQPQSLEYMVGSKVQTMGTPAATQKHIEATTRLTWDVVMNSIYIGQQEMVTILGGTDAERKALFGRFLGLERFTKAVDAIKKDLRKVEAWFTEVESWKLAATTVIQHIKEQLNGFTGTKSSQEIESDSLATTLKVKSLEAKVEELEVAFQQKESMELKVAGVEQGLMQKVANLVAQENACNQQLNRIAKLRGQCPICEQPIKESLFAERKMEVQAEAQAIANSLAEAQLKLQKVSQERKEIKASTQEIILSLRKTENQIQDLKTKLLENKRALDQARLKEGLEETLTKHKVREKRHAKALLVLQEDMLFLKTAIKVVSRDGLPSFLSTTVCPQLEQTAQYYSQLFTQGEIQVHFLTENGEVDIRVENAHGGKTVKGQSRGERREAGFIAVFSIMEVLASYNVLFLDEPGEGLDSRNAAIFAEALKEVATRFGSLYLTTHNPFILSALQPDRHLEVVKENGITTLHEVSGKG